MGFKAHGNINIEVVGRIVINRPDTAFNNEEISVLFDSIEAKAKGFNEQTWMLIEALGQEALPTPHAMDELMARYSRCKALGCQGIACVGSPFQREFMKNMADRAGLLIQFYENEKAAIDANCLFID